MTPRQFGLRLLILLTALLGVNYLVWRWLFSVHWSVWWIAVPLVIAETYSLIDSLLFGLTMWRLKRRPDPGPPLPDVTVDVFITTYNEPLELVRDTARAAQRITYPHTTWILDDGNRPEMRAMAEAEGIGWVSRTEDWSNRPRHAKAGNLNNALMATEGEFLLILDADQVPHPAILERTLGYFADEDVALVQTQQFFVNVPENDPLGSQAPLFYGPIQQGKDGWNAAFFCGSNAILRREALMRLGVQRYVRDLELRITKALLTSWKVLDKARRQLPPGQPELAAALTTVLAEVGLARTAMDNGAPLADVTAAFQRQVALAARTVVAADAVALQADMAAISALGQGVDDESALSDDTLDRMSRRDWSPLGAIETVRALIGSVDVDREDEGQPIMPMSIISVTEDMATCMRLHSAGWKSVYHDEQLALGLAPEDLHTMLTQRLRWAQGTIQVMLRENPFVQKGLSLPQRLMYFATMWSYLSGFTALVYVAAPVLFLDFGVLPVRAFSDQFFARLLPFLILNQILFFVIGRGRRTWRGQQYALALFPVWIRAVTTAVGNVVFGRSLAFAVTPKEKVVAQRRPWHLVRPQLFAMALLVSACVVGVIRLAEGHAHIVPTLINLVWVAFDLCLFWVVVPAVRYRGFDAPAGPTDASVPVLTKKKQEIR